MIIGSGRREPPGSDSKFAQWFTLSATTFSSLSSLAGTTEVVP